MYGVPERRGAGFSRRMLGALEDEARSWVSPVRLETGVHQREALSLYRSAGFEEIPRSGRRQTTSERLLRSRSALIGSEPQSSTTSTAPVSPSTTRRTRGRSKTVFARATANA